MSSKSSKSSSGSPVVKLAMIGIVLIGAYYAWVGAGELTRQIAELPVEGLSDVVPDSEAAAAGEGARQALHPLLVESSLKARESSPTPSSAVSTEGRRLDEVFGRQAAILEAAARAEAAAREAEERERQAREAEKNASHETAEGAAKEDKDASQPIWLVDHFALLADTTSLGAVSSEGAVLSGRYYATGEPVDSLAYPALPDGAVRVPVLENVSRSGVVLVEPHTGRRLVLYIK